MSFTNSLEVSNVREAFDWIFRNKATLIDVVAIYYDGYFNIADLSGDLPERVNLRFNAPADYTNSDKIRIGETEFMVVTAANPNESAPDGIFAEGALVSFNIDTEKNKAYPSFGGVWGDTSAMPHLSYTGQYDYYESLHPTTGSSRFHAVLFTSGTLVFYKDVEIDVFLVNGGNGGGNTVSAGAKGGDGGKFLNYYGYKISKGVELSALIGAGGSQGGGIGGGTFLGSLVAEEAGGLGGAGGAYGASAKGGNGLKGNSSLARVFGGIVPPFISLRFSGGGGGGGGGTVTGGLVSDGGIGIDESGNGGHGSTYGANGYNATDNTGSGGGGAGGGASGGTKEGGKGGSGIIIIRWGDWTA